MFHHLLFVMSLSGSVVDILYGLTYPITRRYFLHAWRKRILHLALFFYLFPLPLFKYFILIRLIRLSPFLNQKFTEKLSGGLDTSYMVNVRENEFFIGTEAVVVCVLFLCMAVIASVVVIKQIRQYHSLRRKYLSNLFHEVVPSQLEKDFQQIKNNLNINKNVKLIFSKLCDTLMTIGVFYPAIIFPASNKFYFEPKDENDILKHELLHIKHRDLLSKFLALLALALHWYNPLCYLLYHELCTVSELDCDYEIVKDVNDLERKRYGNLILDVAAAAGDGKEKLAVGLIQNSTATFERRISEIKKSGENSRPAMICLIMVMIFLMGTVTAFAYLPPNTHKIYNFAPDSEYAFHSEGIFEVFEPLPFDCFFTDENGEVFPLEELSSHTSCPHKYVDGTITEHTKSIGEKCIVVESKARRCRACGNIESGSILFESTFRSCPH